MRPLALTVGFRLSVETSIVEIRLRVGPVPLRDDDVALHALRPRRRRRHFAAGDAVGPVGEHRQRAVLAHRVEAAGHLRAGLSGLDAPIPRLRRTVERAERLRDLARPLGAELVTRGAAAGLQPLNPVGLALDVRRDAVAAGPVPGNSLLSGHADQGEPVAGWIVLGRRARIRRHDRRQVQRPCPARPAPSASRPARSRAPTRCSSPSEDRAAGSARDRR